MRQGQPPLVLDKLICSDVIARIAILGLLFVLGFLLSHLRAYLDSKYPNDRKSPDEK